MIVIPMAGLSSRFQKAGYQKPKYMLDLHGRSLLQHSVRSFQRYFSSHEFLFVARDDGHSGVLRFLEQELAEMNIKHAKVVLLHAPTEGQADTVRLGLSHAGVSDEVPLTIFNIDTFRPNFAFPDTDWADHADGYVEVMVDDDPGFSFVEPSEVGYHVLRTAEKEPISHLASTGLYYFRNSHDFLLAANSSNNLAKGELYIAPLYNHLIARGLDIRFHLVDRDDVVLCGTPDEYMAMGGSSASVDIRQKRS